MHTQISAAAPSQTPDGVSDSLGYVNTRPSQQAVPHFMLDSSDEALVPAADIKRQLVLEEISRSGEMGDSSYRSS